MRDRHFNASIRLVVANFKFDVLEALVFDDNHVIEDVRINCMTTRNTLDCVALFSVYIDALDPGSRGRLRICGGGCDEHVEYDRAEQDPNQCLIGGEQTTFIESNSTRVSLDVFYIAHMTMWSPNKSMVKLAAHQSN